MPNLSIEKKSYNFKLNTVNSVSILVFNPNKIPPHIGISFKGFFFSLKINSSDFCPNDVIFSFIKKNKIPTLIIELDNIYLEEIVFENIKKKYVSIKENNCSCLTPITELLCNENRNFILPELLDYLIEKKMISEVFAMNFSEKNIEISYTKEDVRNHLKNL